MKNGNSPYSGTGPKKDKTKSKLDSKGTLAQTSMAFKNPAKYKALKAAQKELSGMTEKYGAREYINRKFELRKKIDSLKSSMK